MRQEGEFQASEQAWEYLKHIFRLQQDQSPVSTSALAESLHISPSSVTEMLKRLAARGWINYIPYHGITLTPDGERMAIRAIRRHRIVERFLTDMLGFEWHEAHEEALTFESRLSQEVEDRLYVALNKPKVCPHGYPIPSTPEEARVNEMPLYLLEPGDKAVISSVRDDDPELLRFMASLGLRPGARVRVLGKDPFKGPLQAEVDGTRRTLGWHLANSVYVKKGEASPHEDG